MVPLFEIIFATVTLIWGGRLVYKQKWSYPVQGVVYLLGALLIFAMWNRPLAGQWGMTNHGPLIATLSTIGVIIIGAWAYQRWGANARPAIVIVVASLGLVLAFWYPYFVAGPASITPTMPTSPPVASAPAAAPLPPPPRSPAAAPQTPQQMNSACLRKGYPSDFCRVL